MSVSPELRNQIMAQAHGALALHAAFIGVANPLFATLAKTEKATPEELAEQTGLDTGYVARDVREGREELNLSTWNRITTQQQVKKMKKSWEEVAEGEMPLGSIWASTVTPPCRPRTARRCATGRSVRLLNLKKRATSEYSTGTWFSSCEGRPHSFKQPDMKRKPGFRRRGGVR